MLAVDRIWLERTDVLVIEHNRTDILGAQGLQKDALRTYIRGIRTLDSENNLTIHFSCSHVVQ